MCQKRITNGPLLMKKPWLLSTVEDLRITVGPDAEMLMVLLRIGFEPLRALRQLTIEFRHQNSMLRDRHLADYSLPGLKAIDVQHRVRQWIADEFGIKAQFYGAPPGVLVEYPLYSLARLTWSLPLDRGSRVPLSQKQRMEIENYVRRWSELMTMPETIQQQQRMQYENVEEAVYDRWATAAHEVLERSKNGLARWAQAVFA